MTNLTGGSCDKPACSQNGGNRYTDGHGNTVNVCDKHYWELVTKSAVPTFNSGTSISKNIEPRSRFQTMDDILRGKR